MSVYETTALVLAVCVFGLIVAVIWSRRETRVRACAFASAFAIMPLVPALVLLTLSHPGSYALAPRGEHPILGVKLVQDKAIYVWIDSEDHPRGFVLPWNNDTANKMQDLMNRQETGEIEGFTMKLPEKLEDYEDYEIQAMPQPPVAPPKVVDQPMEYRREG